MAAGEQAAEDPARKANAAALRLLAVKPRTRADLARALARQGFEPEGDDSVPDRPERARLIDDAECAEMMVRSRHAYQGLGRRALKSQLLRDGVEGEIAQEAVDMIDAEAE